MSQGSTIKICPTDGDTIILEDAERLCLICSDNYPNAQPKAYCHKFSVVVGTDSLRGPAKILVIEFCENDTPLHTLAVRNGPKGTFARALEKYDPCSHLPAKPLDTNEPREIVCEQLLQRYARRLKRFREEILRDLNLDVLEK